MQYDYDITVIGGGPGGYVAAIKAAKEGKKTCLIEKKHLGGVCLNEGCIPTKTLIKTANVLDEVKHAAAFAVEGIDPSRVRVSMQKLQERKRAVVKQLVGGVAGLLRGNKVTVVEAEATFVDTHTVKAGDKTITSKHFIIATGSEAVIPSFIAQEGKTNILTSREALNLDSIPDSIAIIGGGVIGVEFAFLFNKLGAKVTVLELLDHILPMVDQEVSELAKKRMEKDGITFHLGARVQAIRGDEIHWQKDGQSVSVKADAVLMAVGRAPTTDGLGAEEIGVAFDRGAIRTDSRLRTNIENIYAIGDVNAKVMLAHTASHEGIVAVENMVGHPVEMRYDRIPSCIYLEPEIASIGLTEAQAKERYQNIKVGKFPMAANGKSLVEGDTGGMVKVIVDGEYGEILGAHFYGKHVTDMIAEISAAMTLEATADEIIQTVHPHPTVSESVPEAFMAAYSKAIHWM